MILFVKVEKFMIKCMWNFRALILSKSIVERKNKVENLTFLDFKTCHKVAVFKTVWYQDKG